jgi:hypothetical protein
MKLRRIVVNNGFDFLTSFLAACFSPVYEVGIGSPQEY